MSAQRALLVASLAAALVAGCSGSGAGVARPSGGNVNIRLLSDWGNPIDGGATMSSGAGACSYWKQYQERLLNKHHALPLVAPQRCGSPKASASPPRRPSWGPAAFVARPSA